MSHTKFFSSLSENLPALFPYRSLWLVCKCKQCLLYCRQHWPHSSSFCLFWTTLTSILGCNFQNPAHLMHTARKAISSYEMPITQLNGCQWPEVQMLIPEHSLTSHLLIRLPYSTWPRGWSFGKTVLLLSLLHSDGNRFQRTSFIHFMQLKVRHKLLNRTLSWFHVLHQLCGQYSQWNVYDSG